VNQEPISGPARTPPSPVLTAQESMADIRLVDGFKLELAASEPMIEDRFALSFDEDGRAYVGRDAGLHDRHRSRAGARADLPHLATRGHRWRRALRTEHGVVDKLILPRAVAAVAGGVLYVSDYQLFFARDTDGDGKADHTELVDADYGRGNVGARAQRPLPRVDN